MSFSQFNFIILDEVTQFKVAITHFTMSFTTQVQKSVRQLNNNCQ